MITPSIRPRLSRADAVAAACIALIAIAFFWRFVLTDHILPRGDAFTYFAPYWHYRNEALSAGRLPLWNPLLFMGTPFLANSQAGVLYPPNWLVIPLSAPEAIKVSIVMHIVWAALGTYLFSRRSLHLSILSSSLVALTFALGGYLTAQVEHVNQVQGLAWMVWLFWLWDESLDRRRYMLWLALAFAMQLLAGHTQTAFISGVGLGVWALWNSLIAFRDNRSPRSLIPLGILAGASLVALALAAIQILPTLELARLSNRSGGLPFREAVSFSLRPELIGRGLLPAYAETSLFTEYVAYSGIATLLLAIIGIVFTRPNGKRLVLLILAALGFSFALGRYNPLYWLLIYAAPGFSLFRAPARWLVLWAFSISSLAGFGLDALITAIPIRRRSLIIAGIGVILLIALSPLAELSRDPLIGATTPSIIEIATWIVTLALAMGLVWWLSTDDRRAVNFAPTALAALAIVELFLASGTLPFNHLSAPAAWSSQRPAVSTLIAAQSGQVAPARFLSLSDIRFDPGDLREINAIYGAYLSEEALYDYVIAIKQQEILSPNLPLAWGIPSMDGFDGGILPTRDYTRFTSLFLPDDAVAIDGRLREYLHAVPDSYWLDLANVNYVITDKVFDLWHEGIYYDLQFPEQAPITSISSQAFNATAIGLIGHIDGTDAADIEIGTITLNPDAESIEIPLTVGDFQTNVGSFTIDSPEIVEYLAVKSWDAPLRIERVEISLSSEFDAAFVLRGATLIDQHSGAFLPLSLSPDRRIIQSGDVKIYHIAGTLDRAYVVCSPTLVDTGERMWEQMESRQIPVIVDPGQVHSPCEASNSPAVTITHYNPERVEISVENADAGAYLILSDAWYPGWQATIDGEPANVLQANGIFRAVQLPGGWQTVVFTYRSIPFEIGAGISSVSLLVVVIGLITMAFKKTPATH